MTYEWNAGKAAANAAKHGVTFEDASSVFLDPLAMTYADPDHLADDVREITSGSTLKGQVAFVSHCERRIGFGLSVPARQHGQSENNTKKELASESSDELRPEYDMSQLKGGVRGKYFDRVAPGTNTLVLIEPGLAAMFPDAEAVNWALREVAAKRRRTRG